MRSKGGRNSVITHKASGRIAEMPKVASIIIESGGSDPWGGVGEPNDLRGRARGAQCVLQGDWPLKNHSIQMA